MQHIFFTTDIQNIKQTGNMTDIKIKHYTENIHYEMEQTVRLMKKMTLQIFQKLGFDISPDEGMISEDEGKGKFGPYKQSQRKEIYEAYAKHMLSIGKAYPCFASAEELDEMRAKQEAAKVRPGYYGIWAKYRNLPVDEAAEKILTVKDAIDYLSKNA